MASAAAGIAPHLRGTAGYHLPMPGGEAQPAKAPDRGEGLYLSENLLSRSALWFCGLRWVAIGLLGLFGILGLLPSLLPRIGLRAHADWPFAAAGALAAANIVFLVHARRLASRPNPHGAKVNLWAQILVDLLVLTAVVHYMGSLETYVAFAYLFHIVLACIFFPRRWSLAVTAIACGLYVGCVVLEEANVVRPASIYADATLREHMDRVPGTSLVNVSWATVTWLVVWYLASYLSSMVRLRDNELAVSNRRLVEAQKQKTEHMLQTAHELKAPFAAVDANIQLLLKGYCGPFSDEARDILERVASRSIRLARQIQDMLQLAHLQAADEGSLRRVEVDLAGALAECAMQLQPVAASRGVRLETDLEPAWTTAVADHMGILLANLVSNALMYSQPGGRVKVQCRSASGRGPFVTIEDNGIGIPPDKLPRVFEAYYRTEEGVRHHPESTGLGLAIVRHIAESHGIRVHVTSQPRAGTRFTLRFPPVASPAGPAGGRAESTNGLSDDRG
jgi:signal transduction histidine kinase